MRLPSLRREMHPVFSLQREMNRVLQDFFGPEFVGDAEGGWSPALDVKETADAVTVRVELPGVDPKDVDVSVTDNVLTIRGEKRSEKEEKGDSWHLRESAWGRFSRSLLLPATVDADRVDASSKSGVLTITIPKSEKVKAKKIQVRGE